MTEYPGPKRDYVILALLLFCALRRAELASLDVGGIQMREGRWVLPDLRGKGGRVRTVAIPIWVKHGIDAWMVAAKIEDGRLLWPLSKSGKLIGDELGDWAGLVGRRAICEGDWHRAIRRTRYVGRVRNFAARTEEIWSRSNFFSGTAQFKQRNATSVLNRKSQ
jgi:integrase